MKIAVVSGKSEGPTKLNAFDNALSDAGIGDVNLIKVSSMLKPKTEIVDLPELEPGSMIRCVLSEVTSDNPGDEITAVIALAIGDELGCVVETTGVNKKPHELVDEAVFMVKYMMDKRNVKINKLITKKSHTTVENIASVVSSVIYVSE